MLYISHHNHTVITFEVFRLQSCSCPCTCHEGTRGGAGGILHSFLPQRQVQASQPDHYIQGKEAPVSNERCAEWTPKPVWAFCRRYKSLVLSGNRTTILQTPTYRLVTVSSTLSRLSLGFNISYPHACYTLRTSRLK